MICRGAIARGELAYATDSRAEGVHQPIQFREIWSFDALHAIDSANWPLRGLRLLCRNAAA